MSHALLYAYKAGLDLEDAIAAKVDVAGADSRGVLDLAGLLGLTDCVSDRTIPDHCWRPSP